MALSEDIKKYVDYQVLESALKRSTLFFKAFNVLITCLIAMFGCVSLMTGVFFYISDSNKAELKEDIRANKAELKEDIRVNNTKLQKDLAKIKTALKIQ